ncbi:MAG: hypothetical protein REI09_07285 [Candidatus Dactylopiibacterium sp.]|nr:hypothetical protein [Candidatus Dactylopiibacterium sp.]
MTDEYKVVFSGRIVPGFDTTQVRAQAAIRLKASPEVIERLFSGRAAVLKKGVTQALGQRYVAELRAIGMEVQCEPTTPPAPPAPAELDKTQLADPRALAAYLADGAPSGPDAAPFPVPPRTRARAPRPADAAVAAAAPAHNPAATLVADPAALNAYLDNARGFVPPSPATPAPPPASPQPVVVATPAAAPAVAAAPPLAARGPFGGGADVIGPLSAFPAASPAPPAPGVPRHLLLAAGGILLVIVALAVWFLR